MIWPELWIDYKDNPSAYIYIMYHSTNTHKEEIDLKEKLYQVFVRSCFLVTDYNKTMHNDTRKREPFFCATLPSMHYSLTYSHMTHDYTHQNIIGAYFKYLKQPK